MSGISIPFIAERRAAEVVDVGGAIEAVERVFAAYDRGEAQVFPVVREQLGDAGAVFGVKSAVDYRDRLLGLKAGGYWPANDGRGLPNHQSSTALFDLDSGVLKAVVAANHLTALRTAAASAISAKHLARPDARVLGILGAGYQSLFQVRAIAAVLPLRTVLAWNRTPARLDALAEGVADCHLEFRSGSLAQTVGQCDVLVCVTSSRRPLVQPGDIRPGTHVCAVGTDTRGKQELAAEVVAEAAVYVDSIEQAQTIGECQHAFARGLLGVDKLRGTLGGLVTGRCPGRVSDAEITLFDSTGIALQDLAVAALAVRRSGHAAGGGPTASG